MKLYAIINGDIIGSTHLDVERRDNYIEQLKKLFDILKKQKVKLGVVRAFEIYRGDSFQGAIDRPEKALHLVLILRSFSRMTLPVDANQDESPLTYAGDITDLRLAIGIGEVNKLAPKLMESDGDAFHRSGRLIDAMKKPAQSLAIDTPWDDLNSDFAASWSLLDAIVSRWSPFQAQVVFHTLEGMTQIEIAEKLKASPSAVNQRLKTASWQSIEKLLVHSEKAILSKLNA